MPSPLHGARAAQALRNDLEPDPGVLYLLSQLAAAHRAIDKAHIDRHRSAYVAMARNLLETVDRQMACLGWESAGIEELRSERNALCSRLQEIWTRICEMRTRKPMQRYASREGCSVTLATALAQL